MPPQQSEQDHYGLLESLIGKEPNFRGTPFTAPIAAVLRQDEGQHDAMAYGIIGKTPSCQEDFKKAKTTVEDDFNKAIDTYN